MNTNILTPDSMVESPVIGLSKDMQSWVDAMRFSSVPSTVYDKDFPEKSKGVVPPFFMMVFAPENAEKYIDKLIIEFDEEGVWTHSWVDSTDSSVWCPEKNTGFTIEETAFIVSLQLEQTNRSKSWPYFRAQKNHWSFTQSAEDVQRRIKKIQRAKILRQIELEAFKMLAIEHEKKYEELFEAASVQKALTSDWFIE